MVKPTPSEASCQGDNAARGGWAAGGTAEVTEGCDRRGEQLWSEEQDEGGGSQHCQRHAELWRLDQATASAAAALGQQFPFAEGDLARNPCQDEEGRGRAEPPQLRGDGRKLPFLPRQEPHGPQDLKE